MFNERHTYTSSGSREIDLVFLKSSNVQAFPCSRRRSAEIDLDGDTNTINDKYRIPFDPEARLNTEANSRKHSSLNGFTQTYLKEWNEDAQRLIFSMSGYLFSVNLDSEHNTLQSFGNAIDSEATHTRIYANILLEEVPLFIGFQNYYTSILRDQSSSSENPPEVSLDLIKLNAQDQKDPENYYFSGLSFSTEPLASGTLTKGEEVLNIERTLADGSVKQATQYLVSLCILYKDNGNWLIHEPARLPTIEHGENPNSIVVGEAILENRLVVNKITSSDEEVEVDKPINATTLLTDQDGNSADNLKATKATITTLDGTAANITGISAVEVNAIEVDADTFVQDGYKVPIIELEEAGEFYQLKISRIGAK